MLEKSIEREPISHVETRIRNLFQIELIRKLAPPEEQAKRAWLVKNNAQISELIDFNLEIRDLVESEEREKWERAINLIKEKLEN